MSGRYHESMRGWAWALCLCMMAGVVCLWGAPVRADVELELLERAPKKRVTRLFVKNGKVRIERGKHAGGAYTIYLSSNRTFYVVNPGEKTYTELSEDLAVQMAMAGAEANDRARAKLEERMERMSPKKRAQADLVLQSMTNPTPYPLQVQTPKKTRFTQTDITRTVAGHECVIFRVHRGGKRRPDLCVIDRRDLEISMSDARTIQKMWASMQKLLRSLAARRGRNVDTGLHLSPLAGVGLKGMAIGAFKQGVKQPRARLKSISFERLKHAAFDLPRGYQQDPSPLIPGEDETF